MKRNLTTLTATSVDFLAARQTCEQLIKLAVAKERVRCLAIVEQAAHDDDVIECAQTICFIREGITGDPKPDAYVAPELRHCVASLRAAMEEHTRVEKELAQCPTD